MGVETSDTFSRETSPALKYPGAWETILGCWNPLLLQQLTQNSLELHLGSFVAPCWLVIFWDSSKILGWWTKFNNYDQSSRKSWDEQNKLIQVELTHPVKLARCKIRNFENRKLQSKHDPDVTPQKPCLAFWLSLELLELFNVSCFNQVPSTFQSVVPTLCHPSRPKSLPLL